MELYDVLIVGGGPAGLSAALNVIARGGTCTVISDPPENNPLWKSARIDNYAGMPATDGGTLLTTMRRQAEDAGAHFVTGRVSALMAFDGTFTATVESDLFTGKRLILATGAAPTTVSATEERYLGHGISYCATCDGRLYRGKTVLVTGDAADIAEEAEFLRSVGCAVTLVAKVAPAVPPKDVPLRLAKTVKLWEENDHLRGLTADGENLPADGVFLLRRVTAPALLLPGLETDGRFITVDRQMRTNIAGCYAAGDCTGLPLQIAKAVGEGLIAAQNAMISLREASEQQKGRIV